MASSENTEKPKVFGWQRHYRAVSTIASRDFGINGSSTMLSTIAGSTQNLLSQSNIANLQEDAKCKRISSEVLKHRLYESVVHTQRRRRFRSHMSSSSSANDVMSYVRAMRSMPATPAHSGAASPTEGSPTSTRRFPLRMFLSRGTTPRAFSPEREESGGEEDTACLGLASVLRPLPKVIRVSDSQPSIAPKGILRMPSRNDDYNSTPRRAAAILEAELLCSGSDKIFDRNCRDLHHSSMQN